MPETFIQTDSLPVTDTFAGVADTDSVDVTGAIAETDTAEIDAILHGGDCTIEYVVLDAAGSTTASVEIATPTGAGTYPLSAPLPVSTETRTRVRVTNTDGGPQDIIGVGYEVNG